MSTILRATTAEVPEPPAGIRARKRDRVAGIELEDRRQRAGEVPVQDPPFERKLVDHERGAPIQASRGASSTRSPARLSASHLNFLNPVSSVKSAP